MINVVTLIGRLTKDPVLNSYGHEDEQKIVKFILAVNEPTRKNQQGEKVQRANFINCVAWNKKAEVICKYCQQGALIGIVGRLRTEKYEDKAQKTKFVTKVIIQQIELLKTTLNQDHNLNHDLPLF